MNKSNFNIPKMDCPSEEQMIRMKLESFVKIHALEFDIPDRKLMVYHEGSIEDVGDALKELNLGAELTETTTTTNEVKSSENQTQRKILWVVLAINFGFFIIEITTGFISKSMGLVADSLDMLADSFVYGLSLMAVGGSMARKKNVAKISGYLQMLLALLGFAEVVRRFFGYDAPPDFQLMIGISTLALIGNALCLYLLQKAKSNEAHMKASWIFTSSDILVNLGVIVAGVLVLLTNSNKPDLIIGTLVFALVLRGALRILRLAK
jgi:Co/Zn/Cd efflux system component